PSTRVQRPKRVPALSPKKPRNRSQRAVPPPPPRSRPKPPPPPPATTPPQSLARQPSPQLPPATSNLESLLENGALEIQPRTSRRAVFTSLGGSVRGSTAKPRRPPSAQAVYSKRRVRGIHSDFWGSR